MRNILNITLLLLLTSCSTTRYLQTGEQATKDGQAVIQKGLDMYTMLAQQKDIDESQRDIVDILTYPEPSKMALPNSTSTDFSKEIAPRVQAYKSLLNVYQAFGVLADSKYGNDTQTATNALTACYNDIKQVQPLSTGIGGVISNDAGMITQSLQVKQIKKHNEILYQLTKLYLNLWNKEANTWDEYIDKIYNNYANGLNSVPAKYYDISKIKDDIKEPYNDNNIVLLIYRVQQRDAIIKQKNDLKRQLANFGKALAQLNQTHAELSKDKPNMFIVATSLNNVEITLKDK